MILVGLLIIYHENMHLPLLSLSKSLIRFRSLKSHPSPSEICLMTKGSLAVYRILYRAHVRSFTLLTSQQVYYICNSPDGAIVLGKLNNPPQTCMGIMNHHVDLKSLGLGLYHNGISFHRRSEPGYINGSFQNGIDSLRI